MQKNNIPKKPEDKDREGRERELKEGQDDETKSRLDDVSEETILAEYGFHRIIDEEEQVPALPLPPGLLDVLVKLGS